jgi:hypothetical protein
VATVTKFPIANQAAGAPFNGSWTNPNSAQSDNSTSATSTNAAEVASAAPGKNQEYASVWSVPFTTSDIPNGATINSVTVGVEWRVSTTSSVAELRSTAFADSAQTTAVSASPGLSNTAEPTNLTVQTYIATPTLAQLRDLWIRVQALRGNSNTAVTAYLDYVKVTVDYTAPPPGATGTGGVSFGARSAGTGSFAILPIAGAGSVAFGVAASGNGAVLNQPVGIVGTGAVTFGIGISASGSYFVTPIDGSGGVAFGPQTSAAGTYTLPASIGSGGVSFSAATAGSGSQTESVHGSGGITLPVVVDGAGAVLPPAIGASGGVAFGAETSGAGNYSVTPVEGTGALIVHMSTAGTGAVAPPPVNGSGGVAFGFIVLASSSDERGPWVREGVVHLGRKPHH